MVQVHNIIRYVLIFILNLFVMILFHSYLNFIFLVLLCLLPVYSILGLKQVEEHVSVRLLVPGEAMIKGEEFFVRFEFTNPTLFPLMNGTIALAVENPFYDIKGEHTLNVPLQAKGTVETRYPIVMERVGRFRITATSLELQDLLGFYKKRISIKQEGECLIFPCGHQRKQEAGMLYQKGVSESVESKEKGYDFSDISGIREYIPGDKLQNIHWKLSMKKDELMVKERISVSAMQLNVLVELCNGEGQQLESTLELADSVTKAFVLQNLPFTVFYYSQNQGGLQETYIGNEIERKQWLEMVLYDRCYEQAGLVEDLFFKEYPAGNTYLYIGPSGTGVSEDCIAGENAIVAELRECATM